MKKDLQVTHFIYVIMNHEQKMSHEQKMNMDFSTKKGEEEEEEKGENQMGKFIISINLIICYEKLKA